MGADPYAHTTDTVFAAVASVVAALGAEVVALGPNRHDTLVAVVSHVPHLAAATLMTLADERSRGARRPAAVGGGRLS